MRVGKGRRARHSHDEGEACTNGTPAAVMAGIGTFQSVGRYLALCGIWLMPDHSEKRAHVDAGPPHREGRFAHLARMAATAAGKPLAFLGAVAIVIIWAVTGPLFGYSDTWQLVINTGTTIITFLMVFLIQNTQNRDQMAMQIKLSELIVAMQGAKNKLAMAEEMSDAELERLHEEYRAKCDQTLESLSARRKTKKAAGSQEKSDRAA
jgi:low affinity Fe/Cu permease